MKKLLSIILAVLAAQLIFAAGAKEFDSATLVVGAAPKPHAEMLRLIAPDLAAHGIKLEILEADDAEKLNMGVESGQLDANFFQHAPFMEAYNEEHGTHLVSAGRIHIEPIAIYSSRVVSIRDLKNYATIAIPDDPTNTARALLLLQTAGLIELAPEAGNKATLQDITNNIKNARLHAIPSEKLTEELPDFDAAVINGNHALAAGLSAARDGLAVEDKDVPYVNVVTVKEGRQNDPRIIALVKALHSKKIKRFINNKYPAGEVICAF